MGRFHSWGGAFVLVASLARASALGAYPECDPQYTHQIGNGYCDTGPNTEACGYDGGDCCGCTCQDSDLFECGINGYNCLDPDTVCADLVQIETALDLMDVVSFVPTMTPSSSPTASPSSHPTEATSSPTSSPTSTPTSTPSSDGGLVIPPNNPRGVPGTETGTGVTSTSSKGGLLSGATGIAIAVIVLALVMLLIVCVWRKRRSFSRDATDGYAPPGRMEYA